MSYRFQIDETIGIGTSEVHVDRDQSTGFYTLVNRDQQHQVQDQYWYAAWLRMAARERGFVIEQIRRDDQATNGPSKPDWWPHRNMIIGLMAVALVVGLVIGSAVTEGSDSDEPNENTSQHIER